MTAVTPLPARAGSAFDLPHEFREHDGGRLVLLPRPGVPMAHLALAFDTGAAAEAPGLEGITAVMLALLRAGAGSLSPDEVTHTLESLGINLRSRVSWSHGRVTVELWSAKLRQGLALLEHLVRQPWFEAEAVDSYLHRWASSLDNRAWHGAALAISMLHQLQFPDHRYGLPILGTPVSVRTVERQQLIRDHGRRLLAASRRLIVAGAFDLEELEACSSSLLRQEAHLPGAVYRAPDLDPAPRLAWVERGEARRVSLALALPLPEREQSHGETSRWLAESLAERLRRQLRHHRGWTYHVGSRVRERPGASSFEIATDLPVDALPAALDEILRQTELTLRHLPDKAALNAARQRARGERLRAIDGLSDLAAAWLGDRERAAAPSTVEHLAAAAGALRWDAVTAAVVTPPGALARLHGRLPRLFTVQELP